MEGTKEVISQIMRGNINEKLQRRHKPSTPYFICDYKKESPLPNYTCVAYLKSFSGIYGEGDYSEANVCWFLDEISEEPVAIVKSLLTNEDWCKIATTRNLDDL